MERPHEYAPIEWIDLTEDKIPLSSLSGMDEVDISLLVCVFLSIFILY